ncbi:peptidase S8/S53 domain-containing protein [Xylaria nigripes]|nr:peptidase S8/S53 domain-containing protein [Xylaria nigripes]
MSPINFSIPSGGAVFKGLPIYINCDEAITKAQSAVAVLQDGNQVDVLVSVEKDDKVIKVPTESLPLGRYSLIISELLKKDSPGRLTDFYLAVEFNVIETPSWSAALDPNLTVRYIVNLLIEETGLPRKLVPGEKLPPGARHLQRVKAIHSTTGKIHDLTFENDKQVDFTSIINKIHDIYYEKYGRIHKTLRSYLDSEIPNAPPGKNINVVVWPHLKNLPGFEESQDERSPALQDVFEARSSIVTQIKELGGQFRFSPENAPFIQATVPVCKVEELSRSANVGTVFYDDQTAETDLGNSIAIAGSSVVISQGHEATDVRIAVYEDGPSDTKNLEFAARYLDSPADSNHARLTSAIVKNVESGKPTGHASGCSLYSANSFDTGALAWALESDQNCTAISQGFHRSSGPLNGRLQGDDVLKDYYATNPPFPTIVQAAGNYWAGDGRGVDPPSDEYVNHKGYNTLTVGNHDDSAIVMAGDSTFRNPISIHGDRELPEIAANGTAVGSNEQLMSGTSLSASAVAGAVGLIQGIDVSLQSHPESCRAILLASAKRTLARGTLWGDIVSGVDAKCGAGALDSQTAIDIASNKVVASASPPTVSGWGRAIIKAREDNEGIKATYAIKVPSASTPTTSPTAFVVKAAIAWNSKVKSEDNRPIRSVLELDLDLVIRDQAGAIVAYSCSLDNSYEVVEFYAVPDETYNLEVVHTSGKGATWVGSAWTVRQVEGLAKRP